MTDGAQVLRTAEAADDLVSITVRKENPDQKSGIGLIERSGAVYVTKITENGLFHGSELDIGDVVLSINGKRIRPGEGPDALLKHITKAKATVTMVVKKANKMASRGARSLSPMTRRRKAREAEKEANKIYRGLAKRNLDGSLDLTAAEAWETEEDVDDNIVDDTITAKKIFSKQDVGLKFAAIDNKLFVSKISTESIFLDSGLEVGDRILEINQMSFRQYVDAKYALKIIAKAKDTVSMEVEKGHTRYKAAVLASAEEEEESVDDGKVDNKPSKLAMQKTLMKKRLLKAKAKTKSEYSEEDNESVESSIALSDALSDASSVSVSSDEDDEEAIVDKAGDARSRGRSPGAGRQRGRSPETAKPLRFKEKSTTDTQTTEKPASPRKKSKDRPLVEEPPPFRPPSPRKKSKDPPLLIVEDAPLRPPSPRKKSKDPSLLAVDLAAEDTNTRPASPRKRSKDPPLLNVEIALPRPASPRKRSKDPPLLVAESPRKSPGSTVNAPYELEVFGGHDFLSITIVKLADSDVLVQRVAGKFLISRLPAHEKRINLGDEVLGIEGTRLRGLTSLDKALSLLQKSGSRVRLVINFDNPKPKKVECPSCGNVTTGIYSQGHNSQRFDDESVDSSIGTPQIFTKKTNKSGVTDGKLNGSMYNINEYESDSD
jgi:C-terminal processing protease CtpA/Prc